MCNYLLQMTPLGLGKPVPKQLQVPTSPQIRKNKKKDTISDGKCLKSIPRFLIQNIQPFLAKKMKKE